MDERRDSIGFQPQARTAIVRLPLAWMEKNVPPEAGEREGAPESALARYASRATRAILSGDGVATLGRVRFARRGGSRGGRADGRR